MKIHGLDWQTLSSDSQLILTPNNRIARVLLESHAEYQIGLGRHSWSTPAIFPISQWILNTVKDAQDQACPTVDNTLILSADQELALWQQIVVHAKERHALLGNTRAIAKLAQQAWGLLCAWNLRPDHSDFSLCLDAEQFSGWAKEFQRNCENHGYITLSALPNLLHRIFSQNELQPPGSIVAFAFDDLTPAQIQLFDTLKSKGTHLEEIASEVPNQHKTGVALFDMDEEIRTAARWAKNIVQQQTKPVIGIVVPELVQHRDKVLRAFSEVFEPQHILPGTPRYTPPFNISAGVPFNSLPVIKDAFRCLLLDRGLTRFEEVSALVRSPFIGGSLIEQESRTLLDVALRRYRQEKIHINTLLELATDKCPLLTELLKNFQAVAPRSADKLPSQWAFIFNEQLKAMGWPGQRNLDSEEYQAVAQWRELLNKMAHMDISGKTDITKALELLNLLAQSCTFQPETKDSPIQILGALEAAGLQFTHLWVMNLNDDIWPAVAKPNPYLPITLQRVHNMPHSSPQRELEYSRTLTNRYLKSAEDVVFSYSKYDGDCELRPSPLILNIDVAEKADLLLAENTRYSDLLKNSTDLEAIHDSPAPMVCSDQRSQGGASILTDQAACPFAGFAKHRLQISSFEKPRIGLEARERGTILHSILDGLWKKLKDQQTLLSMSEEDISDLLCNVITETLECFSSEFPILKGQKFLSIEKQRLLAILTEHLNLEKQRSPFRVVATEKPLTINIAGLELGLKIDRIDELLDSNTTAVMDYKSGNAGLNSWDGSRPDQPQLPLYTTQYDSENVSTVFFSRLKRGQSGMVGLSKLEDVGPGIVLAEKTRSTGLPKDWIEIQNHWKEVTTTLAADFVNGISKADPKKGPETCRGCSYKPLCRING